MLRAFLGGLGVAGVAGPLGCFVIWRGMIYFGAALAHSALLGVALALLLGWPPDLGIALLCLAMASGFLLLDRGQLIASDTLLGVLAHASLALGLLALALVEGQRVDLMSYLFGDILALNDTDLLVIFGLVILVVGGGFWFWRPMLASTVNEDLARVEGVGRAVHRLDRQPAARLRRRHRRLHLLWGASSVPADRPRAGLVSAVAARGSAARGPGSRAPGFWAPGFWFLVSAARRPTPPPGQRAE